MASPQTAIFGTRFLIRMAIGVVALLLTACTLVTTHGMSRAENKPIDPTQSGIRYLDAPGATVSSHFLLRDRFYGVALSGGGSRAANFSAATMQSLDEFGLLRGADVISSVSGGGLAGAYYALNSSAMDWEVLRNKLKTNFLGMFLRRWAAPWHWPTVAFTDQTKTDVMADVFDEVLFSRKTYLELPATSPVFLANATDVTAGGKRVPFSNEYFLGQLGSSLANFRIATAVATSAAFPGVFDSVTFERFRRDHFMDARSGTSPWPIPSYVHLIDGGASDNLGVETLWDAALTQLYGNGFYAMPEKLGDKPCVIVSVDANAPSTSARFERIADERGAVDRLFNRNVFDAIDSLFEARRQDTLMKMGLAQTTFGASASENFGDVQENYVDRARVGTFEIPVNCRPFWGAVECQVDFSKPIPPTKRLSFQCFVWHIALDEVAGVGVSVANNASGNFEKKLRRNSLVRLERLVTQTETNWKLSGPESCTPGQLQEALYAAARVLVRDDEPSRFALCDYLANTGISDSPGYCKRDVPQTTVSFPVVSKHASLLNFATDAAHTANLPVACLAPEGPARYIGH